MFLNFWENKVVYLNDRKVNKEIIFFVEKNKVYIIDVIFEKVKEINYIDFNEIRVKDIVKILVFINTKVFIFIVEQVYVKILN